MKKFIYLTLCVLLILVSAAILGIYYTQEFSEKFNLKESLKFADIKIEKNVYNYDNNQYLSAQADIGTLVLENKGYFSQPYKFPEVVGCIDILSENTTNVRNNKFGVSFEINGKTYGYGNTLEIPVGGKTEVNLKGVYSGYTNGQFTKDNMGSVSLYKMDPKERNPLENYDSYNYINRDSDCNQIELSYKRLAVILIK